MRRRWRRFVGLACAIFAAALPMGLRADVVLRDDATVETEGGSSGEDLWVTPAELERISGFVLKPEGLCLEEICVPVTAGEGAKLVQAGGPEPRVNAAGLARRLRQPYAIDSELRVWSFGPVPITRRAFLEQAVAPDFALKDRAGQLRRLSDFRGKKVVLVVWASWCACRDDLPVWEKLYRELKDQGLEIIAVAEDSEGFEAASPYIDAANATYTSLIDPAHSVTAAFNLVNVPTAVWIDEQGTIVRLDDGAYPEPREILGVDVGVAGYADALRDWVARGAESRYALAPQELTSALGEPTREAAIADQEFRLGAYFHALGDVERATLHWERAADLAPDNWNYRRQEWSDSDFESTIKFLTRAFGRGLSGVPYYEPIVLDKENASPSQ